MARIDDPSAAAARRILGLEEVSYAQSGTGDDRVQASLRAFYSLAQLTPDISLPEEVTARVDRRLATGIGSVPINAEGPPADLPRPRSGRQPVVRKRPAFGVREWAKRALTARVGMPTTALVMLVVALALSVGANFLLLRSGQFRPEVAIHMIGTGSSPDAKGVLLFDGKQIVLHASGLVELTSGYRYVAWNASGSEPQYLGSLTMLSDSAARLLTAADALVPVVVVTIEPSASPANPTGPQILVGRAIE